jgi:cytochrome c oxidase cbb3-type subunit II
MSIRNFILGLSASFGFAWLFLVIVPFFKMRDLAPLPLAAEPGEEAGFFHPKREGRIADGSKVYAENGCYLCHTQLVRPTYAGNDMFRPDWGGMASDEVRGDTRRETNAFDFPGEKFAQIGVARMGPDLSNLALRVEADTTRTVSAEQWLYIHLYQPRLFPDRRKSNCPPMPFLFTERSNVGRRSAASLPIGDEDTEIVPNADAHALVSYLLSLRKDHPVPPALNFAPATAGAAN